MNSKRNTGKKYRSELLNMNNEFDVTTLLTAENLKQLQDEFKRKSGVDGIDILEFVIIMINCFELLIPPGCKVFLFNINSGFLLIKLLIYLEQLI